MGAHVRPGLRELDPAQAARDRRQMAPRRGRADDRGREALAVARGGPEWDGAGHPGPEPTRHAGRQASAVQAAEAAMPGAARYDHGQAGRVYSGIRSGAANWGRAASATFTSARSKAACPLPAHPDRNGSWSW